MPTTFDRFSITTCPPDDLAPNQARAPYADPDFTLAWRFPVQHRYAAGNWRVDTEICVFKPKLGVGKASNRPWVVTKKMMELDGSTLAALAISQEKTVLRRLTALGLPCAQLVDDWAGFADPYTIATEFAGISGEEVFKHALPDADYAATIAALLLATQRFAVVGVLAVDHSVRNVCIVLSEGSQGQLCFEQASLIDHRHSVISDGKAAHEPFPPIGLPPGASPELEALLWADIRRAMPAGCPVGRYAELASLPSAERCRWQALLTSPALGGALDRGELRIDLCMQSLLAHSLLDLMQRGTGADRLPSQRLHPQAAAYLARQRGFLTRMNNPDPQQRYPSLAAAAAAWLGGQPLPNRSQGQLTMRAAAEPMFGGSLPEAWSSAPATPTFGPTRNVSARAQAWWQGAPLLHRGVLLLGAGIVAMGVLVAGLVQDATAESLLKNQQLAQIKALNQMLLISQYTASADTPAALQQLMALRTAATDTEVQHKIDRLLAARWRLVAEQLLEDATGTPVHSAQQRARAWAAMAHWSALGWAPAQALLETHAVNLSNVTPSCDFSARAQPGRPTTRPELMARAVGQ